MKKIGIITIIKANNYGAELQAYATQKVFNKIDNCSAEIIDYIFYKNPLYKKSKSSSPSFKFSIKQKISEFIYPILSKIKYSIGRNIYKIRSERFNKFHLNNTKLSKTYYSIEELYNNPPLYDIYVSGSDQIWNPRLYTSLEPYFLTFVSNKAKKISYASSFGVSVLPVECKEIYRKWLKSYYAISVRESNAIDIIDSLGLESICTLDPTLLLNKGEWSSVANKIDVPDNYLVIYELSDSKYLRSLANEISNIFGLKIVRLCKDIGYKDNSNGIINIQDAGPAEFIFLFKNANYIITNSFHGTAFSIIFEKNFYTIIRENKNNNSRIVSLAKLLGLENRIIKEGMSIKDIDLSNIHYEYILDKLEYEKTRSINFIKDCIYEQ